MSDETTTIDLGSHSLRVRTVGSSRPEFVCLHGFVDSLEVWDGLAPGLAEHGRVVLVDQRAHGDSSTPAGPCRFEDLAADVTALMDRLEIDRAILVGHGLGGVVAATAALASPGRVQALVLIGTASHVSDRAAQHWLDVARAGGVNALDGLSRAIYGPTSNRRIEGNAPGLVQIAQTLATLHADPLTPRLGKIACPVLLLLGDRDPMGPGIPAAMKRELTDATLEVVRGRGHWLHVEDPAATLAGIDRFLASRKLAEPT